MKINWIDSNHSSRSIATIGNYIQLEIMENAKGVWGLYLSIRVFKEDGANYSKVCQYQKVASLGKEKELVKPNAEKWFREFVIDQISGGVFGLSDIL